MTDFYDFNHPEGQGMTSMRTRRRLIDSLKSSGIQNQAVLDTILHTPRHLFIDEAMASRAYEDLPLPIGYNQTISQPYIVARMTQAVVDINQNSNQKLNKVLEIGTGSGYQAAVLSKLFNTVYTVERIEELYKSAKNKFNKLKLRNIRCLYNDGSLGWPEYSPYDAIVVTCGADELPKNLLNQLADGGRLVIPVSVDNSIENNSVQQLKVVTRVGNNYNTTNLELVRFVPLLFGKE